MVSDKRVAIEARTVRSYAGARPSPEARSEDGSVDPLNLARRVGARALDVENPRDEEALRIFERMRAGPAPFAHPRPMKVSERSALMEGRASRNVDRGAAARDDTRVTIGPIRWTR
jgi:hypothetical protein